MIEHFMINDLTSCQRLFHGRGHHYKGLEHINVDWFEPVILITLYSPVEEQWLNKQVEEVVKLVPLCQSVQVQHRYNKGAPITLAFGERISELVVTEHDLSYHITLGNSQNHGLFLDMSNGRKWLLERAKNKKVLNLFAYTCAFSIAAIAGGAEQVVNIDMSKSSLSKGRENHRLNKHDLAKVKFEGVDIFKSYSKLKKHGPYDIIVCDPPSFQKGSVNIERDYKKIIKRLPLLAKDGADVLLCLNSPDLDQTFLINEVARECPQCSYQGQLENPEVFIEAHKGKGLKALHFTYQA